MNNITPIFDSLTHPMPNGNWLHSKYDNKNTVNLLLKSMSNHDIKWAIACGMGDDIGGYEEDSYAKYILKYNSSNKNQLYPIAFISMDKVKLLDSNELEKYLTNLVELGYVGVKLHPRFSKFSFCDEKIFSFILQCSALKIGVFLCTYIWGEGCCNQSTPANLMKLIERLENHDANLILVHGGGVRLLEYIEIARAFKNVLLDLSLTLCKYEGSSIDMDLKFAFEKFDQRICIGSDGPEFSSTDLRSRFEYFSKNISTTKKENIAYKNIFSFLPLINYTK